MTCGRIDFCYKYEQVGDRLTTFISFSIYLCRLFNVNYVYTYLTSRFDLSNRQTKFMDVTYQRNWCLIVLLPSSGRNYQRQADYVYFILRMRLRSCVSSLWFHLKIGIVTQITFTYALVLKQFWTHLYTHPRFRLWFRSLGVCCHQYSFLFVCCTVF